MSQLGGVKFDKWMLRNSSTPILYLLQSSKLISFLIIRYQINQTLVKTPNH